MTTTCPPPVRTVEAAPPVHPAVGLLRDAVAAVARAQLAGELASGSLVDGAELLRLAERAAGLALVEVAGIDRHRTWAAVGRASTAGWLGGVLTISDAAARARVALSRRVTEDLGAVGDLLVDGGTTVAHCSAMASGLRGVRPEVVAESVPALLVLARELDPPSLARELRERAHAISPEIAEEQARRQQQRKRFTAHELLDGWVTVSGMLPPEDGQALLVALDAQVHGDREAGDLRDAPARRADALVALAQHALGCDGFLPGQGGSRAQVLVLVEEGALAGVPGSTPAGFPGSHALLTRSQLLRLTCDADVSRARLGTGADGRTVVLDLGRTTRTVTAAQFRALVARDRHCVVRGCRRRPGQCQAHHVWHWVLGGPSDLDNYALVCHLHHHQLHEGARTLQHRDGRWLTPDGYADLGPPLLR